MDLKRNYEFVLLLVFIYVNWALFLKYKKYIFRLFYDLKAFFVACKKEKKNWSERRQVKTRWTDDPMLHGKKKVFYYGALLVCLQEGTCFVISRHFLRIRLSFALGLAQNLLSDSTEPVTEFDPLPSVQRVSMICPHCKNEERKNSSSNDTFIFLHQVRHWNGLVGLFGCPICVRDEINVERNRRRIQFRFELKNMQR